LGFKLIFNVVPDVPGIPDTFEVIPLAVPCIIGKEELIPGKTK
jgi:hypothetical protein